MGSEPRRVLSNLLLVTGATLVALLGVEPALDAAVRPPKLDYTMTTLPNGLNVVFLEDHSTPIVHAEIWYHVGSKNEKRGRTGFAHLFEHMMFKGSKNVEPEGHPSYISSVGGQSNAYTTEDATVFWETFPAQYLPLVLWLEADRLASLRIDERVFQNEREVVKEERRMRVDNQPYSGAIYEGIYAIADSAGCFPYAHSVIGSMDDLNAAKTADVKAFFDLYYAPNNAVLTVVGDFDTPATKALIDTYFGDIPRGATPPEVQCSIRFGSGAIRRTWPDSKASLPAVLLAYPREQRLDVGIDGVIAPDRDTSTTARRDLGSGVIDGSRHTICRGAARRTSTRRVHGRAGRSKFERDTAARATAGAGHQRDDVVQR